MASTHRFPVSEGPIVEELIAFWSGYCEVGLSGARGRCCGRGRDAQARQSRKGKAKAANYLKDDVYNPQHVTSLPAEIRASVYAGCKEPRALHTFAEYRNNLRIVTLHFEGFLCGVTEVRCSASGCLHEVFTLTSRGRYKLTRRYYAKEPD